MGDGCEGINTNINHKLRRSVNAYVKSVFKARLFPNSYVNYKKNMLWSRLTKVLTTLFLFGNHIKKIAWCRFRALTNHLASQHIPRRYLLKKKTLTSIGPFYLRLEFQSGKKIWTLFQQTVKFLLGTICDHFLLIFFLFSFEADFIPYSVICLILLVLRSAILMMFIHWLILNCWPLWLNLYQWTWNQRYYRNREVCFIPKL